MKSKGLIPMAGAYALGVFNDNFFKEAAMLLALAAGRGEFQGHIVVLFALPYLLFAPLSGWLADRFSKRSVALAAKGLELPAALFGAVGILTGDWTLVLAMVFLMGTQACVFGPALNGSIPEIFPARDVVKANGLLKAAVTGAILAGVAAAGLVLAARGAVGGMPMGQVLMAASVVLIAALGFIVALRIPRRPAADPRARFSWHGPVTTAREVVRLRRDPLLAIAVAMAVFIWFMGSLELQVVNALGMSQLKLDKGGTSMLLLAQMVGVALGGFLAGGLADHRNWQRLLLPATALLAAFLFLVAAAAWGDAARWGVYHVLLLLTGLPGGAIIVAVESSIQMRPDAGRRGTVIATANVLVFGGIMLSGPAANALLGIAAPSQGFVAMAAAAALVLPPLAWALSRSAAK